MLFHDLFLLCQNLTDLRSFYCQNTVALSTKFALLLLKLEDVIPRSLTTTNLLLAFWFKRNILYLQKMYEI